MRNKKQAQTRRDGIQTVQRKAHILKLHDRYLINTKILKPARVSANDLWPAI